MDNTVYTALNEYYKLKSKYEKNIQKDRMSVIRNPGLTPAQKRQGLQQIVKRCIVCGNIGGTIFTSNNGILKAINYLCSRDIKPNKDELIAKLMDNTKIEKRILV